MEQNEILLQIQYTIAYFRMENSRLPRKFLFSKPEIDWKRSHGGQVMTWHRGMKEATRKLAAVGQCRVPGWGPRDSAPKWLSTLGRYGSRSVPVALLLQFLNWFTWLVTIFDPRTSSTSFPNCEMASFFFNLFFFSFYTSDSQQRKKTTTNKRN